MKWVPPLEWRIKKNGQKHKKTLAKSSFVEAFCGLSYRVASDVITIDYVVFITLLRLMYTLLNVFLSLEWYVS